MLPLLADAARATDPSHHDPSAALRRHLAAFDAAQAKATDPEDRARLLGVIERSFGDFSSFNAAGFARCCSSERIG